MLEKEYYNTTLGVNTMPADALATKVASASAGMVLSVLNGQHMLFQSSFHLLGSSQIQDTIYLLRVKSILDGTDHVIRDCIVVHSLVGIHGVLGSIIKQEVWISATEQIHIIQMGIIPQDVILAQILILRPQGNLQEISDKSFSS